MTAPLLKIRQSTDLANTRRDPVDQETQAIVVPIVHDVRDRGIDALREYAEHFGDIPPDAALFLDKDDLQAALNQVDPTDIALLERTADRIDRFARAQLESLAAIDVPVPGGRAGHTIYALERAGCYAPAGRYPLPSSVLMTAVTARAAGVPDIWVASPKPQPITLAAAHIAGATGFLAAGGAQAIAALAYGAGPALLPRDIVVGPGNRFVTAAKGLIAGHTAIDMLAGPSELVILADSSADPGIIAADLLAQAEHDPEAVPVIIALDAALIPEVNAELATQLLDLPTADTAKKALVNGFAVIASDIAEACQICDQIAPEHLEIITENPQEVSQRCRYYGGLFIGETAAEVLGDYGAGPNHTLPTGGTARITGGLSVLHFLRIHTWLRIDNKKEATELMSDAERLAKLEGLTAHARAVSRRRT
ncbi:MAG: histidinol dehydrogenase [Myxococcota bacterium]|nr:histidinol dehydrogenase [Myxococcota bacterium]